MPSNIAKEQFGYPTEENKIDAGRTAAVNPTKDVKGATFKSGPLETPVSGGKFQERTAVNSLQAPKFEQRKPEGI